MHGSLDWWARDDGRILISERGKLAYGEKFIEHIMIYPVYEISLEPFYSLYAAFRQNLREEEIIVVIGYAFRDISANNAFVDHI